MANFLQLELTVLATIDRTQSIDAVLLEGAADLHAFDVAIAAATIPVWWESLEGVTASGRDGADCFEEEVLVEYDVAAGAGIEGGSVDGCKKGEEDWESGGEVHG